MFTTIVDCATTVQHYLQVLTDKNELLDVKEISAAYTTNIIASVAFGIDVDSVNNPNNAFRDCGRSIFATDCKTIIRLLFTFMAPKLMGLLRIRSVCIFDHFSIFSSKNLLHPFLLFTCFIRVYNFLFYYF